MCVCLAATITIYRYLPAFLPVCSRDGMKLLLCQIYENNIVHHVNEKKWKKNRMEVVIRIHSEYWRNSVWALEIVWIAWKRWKWVAEACSLLLLWFEHFELPTKNISKAVFIFLKQLLESMKRLLWNADKNYCFAELIENINTVCFSVVDLEFISVFVQTPFNRGHFRKMFMAFVCWS